MKDLLEQIEKGIHELTVNNEKHLEKGNKSAGIRARQATLSLEKLFKVYRKKSIEIDQIGIEAE